MPPPPTRQRVLAALVIGALFAALAYARIAEADFDHLWAASRELMGGRNPYDAIGPGRLYPYPYVLVHPVPTLLVVAPFAWLPLVAARCAFIGVSCAVLAYALTSRGWWSLALFAHASILHAAGLGQVTVLMAASVILPWCGFALATKPQLGAALVAGAPDRAWLVRAALPAVAIVVFSFMVRPAWVPEWLASLGARESGRYLPAVMRPWGFVLLLAALRWRRPEARALLMMALVPAGELPQEFAPLLVLLNPSRVQTLILAAVSMGSAVIVRDSTTQGHGVLFVTLWLPMLAVVLLRPNVSASRDGNRAEHAGPLGNAVAGAAPEPEHGEPAFDRRGV